MNTQWFVVYVTVGVLCQSLPAYSANGASRQETGIADPSVNPGQTSGMRVVRGEVKQATLKTIVVEDANGKEVTMSIESQRRVIGTFGRAMSLPAR